MGHLPPQDIREADVGLFVKLDLILNVDLVVDLALISRIWVT